MVCVFLFVQWVELAAMAKFDVKRGVKFKVHPFSKLPGLFSKLPLMRSDFSPHLVRVADLWWLPRLHSHFMVCSIMFLGRSIAVWYAMVMWS